MRKLKLRRCRLMVSQIEEWVGLSFKSKFSTSSPALSAVPEGLPAAFPTLICRTFFLWKSPSILLQCKQSYENTVLCVYFALFLLRAPEQIHRVTQPPGKFRVPFFLLHPVLLSASLPPPRTWCSPRVFLHSPTFPQHPCCSFRPRQPILYLQHLVAKQQASYLPHCVRISMTTSIAKRERKRS